MKINNINCCLSETIDFYWRVTYTLSEIMVQNLIPRLPLLRLSICFLLLTRLMYFIFLMEKFIEQVSAPFPNDTYLLVAKRLHLKCIWSLHDVQYPTIASLSRFTSADHECIINSAFHPVLSLHECFFANYWKLL